ncbi:sugar transporter family protein [Pseudohyphozyma bogoriensis]|nr:sugar transporter family protein [Pseudohyphozyma bogoriensis]
MPTPSLAPLTVFSARATLNDKLGRRRAIFIGSLTTVVGSALQGGSVAIAMYLVARFITGFGVGFLLVLIPQYQNGVGLCLGYFCSVWFGYAFYITTSGADDPTLAEDELFQIRQQQQMDEALPSSWLSIVTQSHYRKRAIIGFLTTFFVQCTGNLVLNNYTPLIYSRLGFDTNLQLLLTGAWITMCPFGNMLNAVLLDRIGRKPLLVTGLLGTVSALVGEMVCVGVWGGTDSVAGNRAAVFFLFYHMLFFSSCCDATSYVLLNEIWPNHMRAKGSAVGVSGLFAATIIYLSAAPTAFATIGWKFYLTLAIPAFLGAFAIIKFWPETKGLPLEEIGVHFGDPVAVHLSDVKHTPGVREDKPKTSYIEKSGESSLA